MPLREGCNSFRGAMTGLLLLLLPSLIWVGLDGHCWEWDQARYAHMSFDLWQYQRSDPVLWFWTSFHHLPTKAPGISWMGQWFVYLKPLVGSVDHALMLQPMFCTFCSGLLLRRVALHLLPENSLMGWIALVFPFSSPLFMGLHQEYMTEPMQLFGISWVLWLAVRQRSLRPVAVLAHGMGALALCLMSKGVTPMYIWGFGLLILAGMIPRLFGSKRERLEAPWWMWAALAFGAVMLALAIRWYVFNAQYVFGYVVNASSGAIADAYGADRSYWEKTCVWLNFLYQSYATLFLIFILALGLILAAFRPRHTGSFSGKGLLLAACVQMITVWTLITNSPTEEWRPLLGLLPSFLVVLCLLVQRVGRSWYARGLLFVLLGQWALIHASAFGVPLRAPFALKQPLRTPDRAAGERAELYRIIETTCAHCPTMDDAMMCAVSLPWLNGNTLKYYAATEVVNTPRYGYYGSTGFLTGDLASLQQKFEKQDPCIVISMDLANQLRYPTSSPAGQGFIDFIEQHPDYEALPFPSAYGVRLFGRRTDYE